MRAVSPKGNVSAMIAAAVAGLQKHYAGKTLLLDGVQVTTQVVVDVLNAYAAAIAATAAARAVWTGDVAAERKLRPTSMAQLEAVHDLVRLNFGTASPVLADFGMTPRTPGNAGKKTVAVKAAALEKSRADPRARHTMGPKQKAKIHGVAPTASPLRSSRRPPAAPVTARRP